MLKPITILLTGAGAPGAPSIIKCLKNNGEREIRIIGVDMNEKASGRGLVDAFFQVPPAKDEGFIDTILGICKKEKVQVLFPLVTKELISFSRSKELFTKEGVLVSVANYEGLEVVNNKANLLSAMKRMGMDTPKFIIANNADEVEKGIYELGYPQNAVCVKSAEGNGSRGVRIIDHNKSKYELLFFEKPNSLYISIEELMSALREREKIPQMLVMEYLSGEEYGVDALCDHGKVICIAGRYNYTVQSSIPQGCIIQNREIPFSIAERIIREFCLDGNVNFDFIYDSNHKPKLIEINPRLSATIVAYAPAGINFPYLRVKMILGEEIAKQNLCEGLKMQRRYNEVFYDTRDNEVKW